MGRVRAAKSKVRTGCRTCKARRVKCDEGKPDCHRCSSTGRECGGYEIIAPKAVSQGHPPRVILPGKPPVQSANGTSFSNPPTSIPGATVDEMNYFTYFCRYTAPTISATALGALQRAQERNGQVTLGQEEAGFALRQYVKAINLAREKLMAPDLPSQRLELVACVLFVCFEIAQKRCRETAMHLEHGMNLLVNVRHRGHLPSGWDTDNFDSSDDTATLDREITRTFDRLDIQSTFVRSTKPKLSTDPIAIARKTPRKFSGLEQAREYLNALTRSVATFRHQVRATPTPFTFEDESRLKIQQMQIRTQMQAWNAAFGSLRLPQVPLPPGTSFPQDVTARAVLEGMAIYASILLETGVADGEERIFDNFTSDFKLIVDLGQIVKDHPRHRIYGGASGGGGGGSFHIHMACVPTVYIVALKCRDPTIRRRALDLLETLPFREGMWDAPVGAQLCRHVMQLEESGYEGLRYAQDLPERARIHEAMFDILDWDGGTRCYYKRRDFDGEYGKPGSWLSWSGRAQVTKTGYEESEHTWDHEGACHNINPESGRCLDCGRLGEAMQPHEDQVGWAPVAWYQAMAGAGWDDAYSSSGDGSPLGNAAPRSPPQLRPPGMGSLDVHSRSRTLSNNTAHSHGTYDGTLDGAFESIDFASFNASLSSSPE